MSDTKSDKGCGAGGYTLNSPWSFETLSLAPKIWWPYIHRDILAKVSECKACKEYGKNEKSVIPHCKWPLLPKWVEPMTKYK